METLGQRVRHAREARNVSQSDLARQLGMKDQSPLSKIERSSTQRTSSYVGSIAEILGVRVSWLLKGAGPMDTPRATGGNLPSPVGHDSDAMLYQIADPRSPHTFSPADALELPVVEVARSVLENVGVTEATSAGYIQPDSSMSPTLSPGDQGILDVTRIDVESESGSLFAIRKGRSVVARRIIAHTGGSATIVCDSADKRLYVDETAASLEDIEVLGRLVWSSGKK